MSCAKTLKELEQYKTKLQTLEKEVIKERGKLEQEESKMKELGFLSLSDLDAEIERLRAEEIELVAKAEELVAELKETYADYI